MKPRKLIVKDIEYRYLVSAQDEWYGMVKLRVFVGPSKTPLIEVWLRQDRQPVTPGFVAAQIGYATEPFDYHRASGDCVCTVCNKPYYDHPLDGPFMGSFEQAHQWLRRTCAGELVKL